MRNSTAGYPREVLLERMRWPDVEEALRSGMRTVVICAGAQEQHGHHLPEGTDAIMGQEQAVRLAIALGDALVAPVIRPGCSDHHMDFPGTITISADLLIQILDAYIASLRHHGFERFVVFSSHGGNFPVLARWMRERPQAGVIVIPDRAGFDRPTFEVTLASGTEGKGRLHHSDALETSQMLVIAPDLVELERAQRGYVGDLTFDELFARGTRSLSPTGVLGDPAGASAEYGEVMLTALTAYLARRVAEETASAT